MVWFPVHLNNVAFEFSGSRTKSITQLLYHSSVEKVPAVFRGKNQVYNQLADVIKKEKSSTNHCKARLQLAVQYKLSRAIVDENQAVIVETLKAANMMKNHYLARAIGDAGWSGFIAKLKYKATEKGVHVVKLEQWFASSKTCHCCGHKMPEMPLNKRTWQCPECGVEHERDINAAINIERKGILELQAAGLVVSAHGGQHKSVAETVAA